jgi:hypothetical protein
LTLVERMKTLTVSAQTKRCAVAVVLGCLDNKESAQVMAALQDKSIAGSAIASVLRDEGHNLSAFSVNRHRRRECACS